MTEPVHFESMYPENSRQTEIDQVLGIIKSGSSVQITGLPGVGRSTLLELLSFNKSVRLKHLGDNQKWFHFVLLNSAEIKDRSISDVIKFVVLSTADSLRDRGLKEEHDKLHEIFKEHASFNDEIVLFQGLKEAMDYLTLEKELTIVFMFDRFEEYIPSLSPHFFSHLRVLRDRAKYRFSAIFSTPRLLEDLVDPLVLSDFFEFISGNVVYVELCDQPSLDFRIAYTEKATGKSLDEATKKDIISLTGGHGKLTRVVVEEIISSNVIQNEVKDLGTLLIGQKSIQRCLYELWNFLTPAEQNALSQAVISSSAMQSEKSQDETLKFLEKAGLLLNNTITIPLFSAFIKSKSESISDRSDKIEFNPQNKTIVKGYMVISENLTASEFKLLKYLLENTEKVIEREELIQAVWGDAKSTAGVTDQAVDQLIFRLRKKIEDDPNSPAHLITVKGRGFKFSP